MAEYWKFAELLTVHVTCLYNIHKRDPPSLENEPRHANVRGLTDFKVEALYARVSILEFLGILRKGPSNFTEPGQETTDLGIKEGASAAEISVNAGDGLSESLDSGQQMNLLTSNARQSFYPHNVLPDLMQSQQWNLIPPGGPGVDMFSPAFDLYNSELLAANGSVDLTQNEITSGFLDIDGWDFGPMSMV
ncbi:uncharacterized protein AB675_10409 [Cyphellophora attinorum]|uniref:Uncharacterized protein n=1 Tax=Cyphellophora attinorum TaxID=1664694 RepID=A0A0N1H465_9EURO|nr:uncharacterized protein AB675_10409 [Phialophora attinorum]KPI35905.1 hypothetical protein AB675_10409 [Phialophora attinorum]